MAGDIEKRVRTKFILDSTGFNSSLKGVNSGLRNAKAEFKLASQGLKSFGADSEKLKSVQQSLAKQVGLHSKKVDIYRKSIEKTKGKLQENIRTRDKLKSSLNSANKKYEEAVKIYGKESEQAKKAKDEVNKLTEKHKKSERAVESNAKKIQQYDTNLNKAKSQMVKAQGELKNINRQLDKSSNKWLRASQGLNKHGEKLTNIGGKITNVGKTLTTHVSAPLAAVGLASAKVGMDFEAQMDKVQAISGATGEDFNKLKAKAEEMGSKTKFSATESAEGLEYMATAGWKTGDMLDGLPPILDLATAAGADLGQTSDIVTDALTAFGLKAKDTGHFSDILASASSNANTNVLMMGESFKYAAPIFGSVGYSAEDAALGIGLMANAGIKGTQSGTALRSIITRLVKPTKESASAMDTLGLKITDDQEKMKPFNTIMEEMRSSFAKLNPEQKASVAAQLAGQEAMSGLLAIVNAAPEDYNQLKGAISNCDGATKKMSDTMQGNAKGSITEMKSALEGAGIKIFKVAAPSITSLAKEVTKMADKFSKLNPKTQETIVKMGALGMATGPLLGGIGKITTGVGGLFKIGSKVTGLLGKTTMATKGVTTATGLATKGIKGLGFAAKIGKIALNPWTLGIAAAGMGAYKLHKHMSKECVPSVNLFNSKVKTTRTSLDQLGNKITVTDKKTVKFADSTKKAVGGFVALSDGAKKNLTELYVNSTKITDKTAKALTKKYKEMGEQIKKGEDKKYKERLDSFKKFLDKNEKMSEEDKKKALQSMEDNHKKQQEKTDNYVKQIQDILEKASEEKRALTKEEQEKINEIQEKMKTEGVKKLSKTEEESKVILGRIKDYGKRITAEQASEIIKNAEKQRKGSVEKANQQYNQTVEQIRKMRDEDKTITADQAEQMIKDAKRQKEESVKQAEKLKRGVVKKIGEMNSDTLDKIDEGDGHIKSKWEKLGEWFANNPIIRWIKTKVSGGEDAGHNWTGTNYWSGGLTYLHDAPGRNTNYELYDLPRGTRIFNHDASEDLVRQTAENVATKVAEGMLNKFNGGNSGINVTQYINSPTPSPSEVARQTKNSLRELSLEW